MFYKKSEQWVIDDLQTRGYYTTVISIPTRTRPAIAVAPLFITMLFQHGLSMCKK